MPSDLKTLYKFHRATLAQAKPFMSHYGLHAATALRKAREDAAEGKSRYAPTSGGYGTSGKPFEAFGEKAMRWIENPREAGLRFVGYCDELSRSIQHKGWFIDNDQNETVRGVVFQLAGRGKAPVFVAGYEDPHNGKADSNGPVCLSFERLFYGEAPEWNGRYWSYHDSASDHEAARDAARYADGIAERYGEEEREYEAAWHAGVRFAELAKEVAETRRTILKVCSELRIARGRLYRKDDRETFFTLCAMARRNVARLYEEIQDARKEMSKLKEGDFINEWLPGFNNYESRLVAAFNEGADI